MAILVYVDDIIIARPIVDVISTVKTLLHSTYQPKDLGHLKYFLVLEVAHSTTRIVVYQRQYTLQFPGDFWSLDSKSKSPSMASHGPLHTTSNDLLVDATLYQCLIGRFCISLSLDKVSPSLSTH